MPKTTTNKNKGKRAPTPSAEQVAEWIRENPSQSGKREIARAFGLKGQQKIALKAVLKEREASGVMKRRGKRFSEPGQLPPTTVLDIVERDRIIKTDALEMMKKTELAEEAAAEAAAAEMTISGKTLLFARTTRIFAIGFVQSMSIALALITAIIAVLFRSWRLALISVAVFQRFMMSIRSLISNPAKHAKGVNAAHGERTVLRDIEHAYPGEIDEGACPEDELETGGGGAVVGCRLSGVGYGLFTFLFLRHFKLQVLSCRLQVAV